MSDIPDLLTLARRALDEAGVRHAVIGGCARNAYAEARATKDVDFVVDATESTYPGIAVALVARAFRRAVMVKEPEDVVPDFESFRDPVGRRIDLLFAKTDFERSALDRSEERTPYAGVSLAVVSPEDLIVYKLLAGRTQDWSDLEAILETQAIAQREIDWLYIERWAREWEVEDRVRDLRARMKA